MVIPNSAAFGSCAPDLLGLPRCVIVGGHQGARTAQETRKHGEATKPLASSLEAPGCAPGASATPSLGLPSVLGDPRRTLPPPAFGGVL
jgi:hypothetical protein